ncbi:MAG: prepilin-type N-terminal cleavage/methylation domain-containing protein, partial [Candidatus Zixiibacteriota bacterium]
MFNCVTTGQLPTANRRIRRRCSVAADVGANEKGITLLEVMVSMIVISIGLLGILPLIGVSIHNNTYSFDIDTANSMAREEVESLMRTASYPQIPYYRTNTSSSGVYSTEATVDDNSVSAAIPPGVFRIRVKVNWVDQANNNRTVEYAVFKPKA